jgi:hypothetical protein
LRGPAKVTLAAAGVGGAAYLAARRGVMAQVKERLGRSSGNGFEQPTSFEASGIEIKADPVAERAATEPPSTIVNTEPAGSLAPERPPNMR